jgi:hypothetical protein
MQTVVGVVQNEERAREVANAIVRRAPQARIRILTPRESARDVAKMPADEAEQPGMGSAIGAVAGGAAGAAVASLLVPPAGAIAILGLAAGALLGGLGGMAAGDKIEDAGSYGLSRDELLVYADVLRRGNSIVVAWVEANDDVRHVREVMADAGVGSIDAARDAWWVGIRDAEAVAYGDEFDANETSYRQGFEAACRGDECRVGSQPPYAAGHARGRAYGEEQMRQLAVTRPSAVGERPHDQILL